MKVEKSLSRVCFYFFFLIAVLLIAQLPVNAAQIIVHASAQPGTTAKGQSTEIFVNARTSMGDPIPQAHVKISVGGGFFLHSKTTTVHGQTNPQGDFGTPWLCNQCAGGYGFVIEVTKPGFQKGTANVHVNISSQPVQKPIPGGQIIVHSEIQPPTVSKGQPTEIFVKALTPQGTPIPQAHVKISVGGGFFLHTKTTTAHGQTNAQGDFGTPWQCNQCAGGYEFVIEVTKPGFKKGTNRVHVNISSQPVPKPMPIPGSQIVVHPELHPPTVSRGQPTEIFVRVQTPQGIPIANAHVKIGAGGGIFLHFNGLTVNGQTNANGEFATPWKCNQCAPAYVFDIEVTKPGLKKGKAQATVKINTP